MVEGELTKAYLTSGAAKLTAKADSEVDTVYAKNENCVKGLLSHHIKKYEEGTQIDSFNYGPRSSGTYYRNGRSYGYRSDLGVSGIVDRGDRISFDCDVSGATVRWNGSEIGTTDRGSNTFDVDRNRYRDDRLTISKDGYETEVIYLDNYYGEYYRYKRSSRGYNYWRE